MNGANTFRVATVAVGLLVTLSSSGSAAPINLVSYGSLTGTGSVTFDDIAGGAAPGTNYNGTFVSSGETFGERFVGQTLSANGAFDVLGGSPTGTLAVQAGATNQNLNVFINAGTNVLTGLGNLGFPEFDAIGEGAFAVLFAHDQSQFGFQLVGGDGGTATVSFFRRDSSLISTVSLTGLANAFYGFQRDLGLQDIAGISISNNDPAGVGFDNLKFDVPAQVPEPTTLVLIALGGSLASWRRRRAARR